jgi:oxygen-independent coproporphyrinogen-3 oxidase
MEKLQAMRAQGVNRLSINPQTMHDRTLKRIGRSHTVEDILRVYKLAREIPGWIINMDLILGLPGESVEDIQSTLEQIGRLYPDNLTVHALAIKRGSKVHESGLIENLGKELESMQEIVLSSVRSFGLRPYYLYRQKHIAGNLENIGFARSGMECRYNIGIMEERQSVIGIGAGASSKVVNPIDYSLVNMQHPSNWQTYLERWMEIQTKRSNLVAGVESRGLK